MVEKEAWIFPLSDQFDTIEESFHNGISFR